MPAIFRGPKKGYTLASSDIEWLARSMWGEASTDEGRIAVAWSHINRFLLVNYRWMQTGWSFKQYMQSHSQPINPAWSRDGKFCRLGGKYHDREECAESLLRRRERLQTHRVPDRIMALAEAFADGEHPSPFSEPTYDFAACWLTQKQRRPHRGIELGGNCHLPYSALTPKEVTAVIPGEVRVEGLSGLPPREIALPFIGIFLAACGALYAWWRYSH